MYLEFDVNIRNVIENKTKADIYFELYKCDIINARELTRRLHELGIQFDSDFIS